MALARWKDLCLDAVDMDRAAAFWAPVLDLAVAPHRPTVTRLHGDRREQTTWVNLVTEPKVVKNRVHLDLVRDDVTALLASGAHIVHEPEPGWTWHLLEDPEGNELCAFTPGPDVATALVLDAIDAEAAASWWAEVLGATLAPGPDGGRRWLRDVPGLPFEVWKFVNVPDPKTVKNRWHWDVVCDDVPALVARGATVLREPGGDIDWHVLADPEGNEFCAFPAG